MATNPYTCSWCKALVPAGKDTHLPHKGGACRDSSVLTGTKPAPAKPQKTVPRTAVSNGKTVGGSEGMPRVQQGGTNKWCPRCQEIRVCAAINPSRLAGESGQRWVRGDHKDITWFRRGLVCQTCGHEWLTAEVHEDFLDELVELRDALRDIKAHAEEYIRQSGSAARALDKLGSSLKVLRALDVYKRQNPGRDGSGSAR